MIDLDDALIAEAAEILGTTTERATVNGALAEFVAAVKRQRFMDMLEEGVFSDLGDPEVIAKAWPRSGIPPTGVCGRVPEIR